jgi:hypothetical protein
VSPFFDVGIGYSYLHIDDIEFQAITDFFVTQVQDHQSNQDGELNGYKLTAELAGLAAHRRGDWLASFAVKGFYSRYEGDEQTRCVFTADSDCVFFPLVDPDPSGTSGVPGNAGISDPGDRGADASGGFFSDWLTDVSRSIVHWGAALELNLNPFSAPAVASLKDEPAPAAPSPFQWRAGVAIRGFDQDTYLFSEDRGPTLDPVTLDDNLDTSYYGGYFGFTTYNPLAGGVRLKLSGETGLYYASTDYSGAYTATASLGDDSPVAASIELSDSAPAFIGALNLALERDFGSATFAIFGEAEWISYVPKVLYNDTDLNGGVPFDIVGTQNGTALGEGSAMAFTVGARVSVPLQ